MSASRKFLVPKPLIAALGEQATLDDMERYVGHNSPVGAWSRKVIARENAKILDELLGDSTRLPRGVLADDAGDLDVVVALINEHGEIYTTDDSWHVPAVAASGKTCELDDNDVAFIARAMKEGVPGVVMRVGMPLAFLAAAPPATEEAVEPESVTELPEKSRVVAIVDPLDKNAVLEAVAIAPGPVVYRRHDGQWIEDPAWVAFLSSVKPPHMVKLDEAMTASVTQQVDQATAGQEFVPFEDNDVNMYRPLTATGYLGELQREADNVGIEHNLALVAVATSPKGAAGAERLKRYWMFEEGAAKIRWYTPGSWRRCYRQLVKYVGPKVAPGLCTNMGQRLGGHGVATHVGD